MFYRENTVHCNNLLNGRGYSSRIDPCGVRLRRGLLLAGFPGIAIFTRCRGVQNRQQKKKCSGKIKTISQPGENTVEPRFNEVPRDWGNLLAISRVRYIENLDITKLWKSNQNVRYIEV